jgi:hypothetical protein
MNPIRIQRSRKHKQVSPNGLPIVYVGRPGKFGNPARLKDGYNIGTAISFYQNFVLPQPGFIEMVKKELKGKNLSCWCRKDQLCHADILLEIANS